MRNGKQNKKITSSRYLKDYKSPKFKPHLDWSDEWGFSCGTTAISTLTGKSPNVVQSIIPKNIDYWTDKNMVRYLTSLGYEIKEITKSDVTRNPYLRENPITKNHVVLIGQEVLRDEGTWAIIFNNKYIHNFCTESLNPLELLNNPTDTVYVVTHRNWK